MLAFLDAGVNVKGAPNENFAREIMELFTMGVGNYTEKDIREAARAFTGWNFGDLTFVVDPDKHDDGAKTVLGQSGNFDGVEVIDVILAAAGHRRVHRRQDLSLLRAPGPVTRDAEKRWATSCATTTTRSRRCSRRSSCRRTSTARRPTRRTSRARSSWSCRPTRSSA